MQVGNGIGDIGTKTKKYVDIAYIILLFLFMSAYACRLTSISHAVFDHIYSISSALMCIIAIYRVFFLYFSERKKAILPFLLIVLGVIIFYITDNNIVMQSAVMAVAGLGMSADLILTIGISGNIVMIINNIIVSLTREPGVYTVDNQPRNYFFLGNNTIFAPKLNNFSSTDLGAHYFWIFAAYFWVRGKKILWGEILALSALNLLVYALSASKTTFLCISLLLIWAVIMKIYLLAKNTSEKKSRKNEVSDKSTTLDKICSIAGRIVTFCCRYSFVIFAALCIALALLFSCSRPLFLDLNNKLHWRLSLGQRGITEYGIHLVASGVHVYGMSSSVDGFYNFLDCSYVAILVRNGILALLFYLFSMSFIQYKHKNYIYGIVILAVCALSCMEEHHLWELPYNMFMLLVFADFNIEKKSKNPTEDKKPALNKYLNVFSFVLCAVFCVSAVVVYYPKYNAVKELDRLDEKAGSIYTAVQDKISPMVDDGSWQQLTSSMSSYQYGEQLNNPEDYIYVTGVNWNDATDDPKVHSYYSVYYDAQEYNETDNPILDLMITDEVKELVGTGSAVIEYDVISGKVYSVWYAEEIGCHAIASSRNSDRTGRLRSDVTITEGYSTGNANG